MVADFARTFQCRRKAVALFQYRATFYFSHDRIADHGSRRDRQCHQGKVV